MGGEKSHLEFDEVTHFNETGPAGRTTDSVRGPSTAEEAVTALISLC